MAIISPKKNTKKKFSTKLEQEKTTKQEFYETAEKIFEAGHENRKRGVKAILEIEKDKAKAKDDVIAKQLEKATSQRRFDDFNYLLALREAAVEGINQIDYADYPGWRLKLFVTTGEIISINKKPFRTEKGLLAVLISP